MLGYFSPVCPTPSSPSLLTAQKIKIKKKTEKNTWTLHYFTTSVPKIMIICYTVPEIWHVMDAMLLFVLGYFLLFYYCNRPKISLFYTIVPKIMIIGYTVPEIWRVMYVIVPFHFRLFFSLLLP